eukprot:m.378866 g.378866  ORF g.378866 m.378866 type:complete len:685 (-) comp20939_c0_seq1:129-2183(-)
MCTLVVVFNMWKAPRVVLQIACQSARSLCPLLHRPWLISNSRGVFVSSGSVCQGVRVGLSSTSTNAGHAHNSSVTETHFVDNIRNIAVIAHVDHGKTTLVDGLLKQSGNYGENEEVAERVMDSGDIEKERGITILAKNTAIERDGIKVNVLDTPGHADFGGEVERILNMVDGVLLLVDAQEGPMPQTRFVLKKALGLGLQVLVCINKVDKPAARPDWVVDTTFDLFAELAVSDEQLDFPTVYASGKLGRAGLTPQLDDDLSCLFDAILDMPKPRVDPTAPLVCQISNLGYDSFSGRSAIGRIMSGSVRKGQELGVQMGDGGKLRKFRVSKVHVFSKGKDIEVDEAFAGDICTVYGIADARIGDTVVDLGDPRPLRPLEVEPPTVKMTFGVNTSPFAGQSDAKLLTSAVIKERLLKETLTNLAIRVDKTDSADEMLVSGRGTLQLGILIEEMRREGYEFQVSAPTVVLKEGANGERLEPVEKVTIEVPEEYQSSVIDLMNKAKGEMLNMEFNANGTSNISFKITTRGLIGMRNKILTATRGHGVMSTAFDTYERYNTSLNDVKEFGSLVGSDEGVAKTYALLSAQNRGELFVHPAEKVYKGMIVGLHQRAGDLPVNVCRAKQQSNVRSAAPKDVGNIQGIKSLSLDDCLEYIDSSEMLEVTPSELRLRKRDLVNIKQKTMKDKKK